MANSRNFGATGHKHGRTYGSGKDYDSLFNTYTTASSVAKGVLVNIDYDSLTKRHIAADSTVTVGVDGDGIGKAKATFIFHANCRVMKKDKEGGN